MADLRSKFIEDYAGGLLNVSRQELASTGEVLSQDGFLSNAALFVEDGSGTKSGLLLGASLCEVVDPTTDQGAVNVRYADRTYASVRDLKIFSTAIASAQAALSDATSTSITNLENAFELLENAFDGLQNNVDTKNALVDSKIDKINTESLTAQVVELSATQKNLETQITTLSAVVQASFAPTQRVQTILPLQFESFGAVATLSVDTGADRFRTAGDYTVTGLTSTNGTGLSITVNVDANGLATVTGITSAGSNFVAGDKVIVPDSSLGGGGADPVTITVSTVIESTPINKLVPQVQALIAKVNEILAAFS